jgi:hypothetical protein
MAAICEKTTVSEIMASAIGPFEFNDGQTEVTLSPGIYVLQHPITFGIVGSTAISGVHYSGNLSHSKDPQCRGNQFT